MIKAGDIFGEMAILENRPRSASAISFGDVSLMAINKSNFESMVQAQPQLATRLIQLLSERIWTAYRQLENLTITDLIGRVYDTLLIQIEKQKMKIRPKQPIISVGVKELFTMLGVPNTIPYAHGAMLEDKLIVIDQGKIICNDIADGKAFTFLPQKIGNGPET